jgi:hypothetical protein
MKHTSQVWVINLHISESIVIKNFELSTVRLRNVGEILCICSVDFLGESSAGLVSQVIPIWSSHGELRFTLILFWEEVLQVVPLVDVRATNMLDFASAEDRLSGLVT